MSDKMTVQVIGHETGKENDKAWTRLMVANSRGRFPVKFRNSMATSLTRDLVNTLSEGETITTKRLFIELAGEWNTFTRPDGYKVRFFKPEGYKIINGPSLELARIRGDALGALQTAETLRNAGALAQAYKVIATYAAELAHFPLDLSEVVDVDDALIGQVASEEEGFNPEAAAAAHYERVDAAAQTRAAEEDAVIEARDALAESTDEEMDEIVLAAASSDELSEIPGEDPIEIADGGTTVYQMLDSLRGRTDDSPSDDEEPSANSEEAEASAEVEEAATPAPAPVRRFGFGRR